MKEDMFEVLMYLFENHMQSDCKLTLTEDILMAELERAGFSTATIDSALDWLEGLIAAQESTNQLAGSDSFRIYTPYENYKLSLEIINFMLFLQQRGILNTITRELVIDRLMAIDDEADIELSQVKWVTLLVLFNQPEEAALACMESLVLENSIYGFH